MTDAELAPVPVIELSAGDLPAYCPRRLSLWRAHPRVFLDVVNRKEARCEYCGTRYRLAPAARLHDHQSGRRDLHQHRASMRAEDGAQACALPAATADDRRAANLRADRYGHTTLELMTQWLRDRRLSQC